ncbi:MAG: hypothetical protein K8R35_09320 [Bacteroidales bacterium]|nr:hypothetical protein [Bacteroidales bacterium]
MDKKRDMKKHVTFVAALHIGFGVLGVIGMVILFFVFNLAQSFVTDVEVVEMAIVVLKIVIPLLVGLGAVLGIIGGIGLFSYRQWARMLIIVLSAINCLNVPIGTAKGVYSIWTLLQDETIELFNEKSS